MFTSKAASPLIFAKSERALQLGRRTAPLLLASGGAKTGERHSPPILPPMCRLRLVAPIATAVLLSLPVVAPARGGAQAPPKVPAELFAKPTGRFAIGVLDTLWVDSARPETLTSDPNDKRHVLVRIWYPAATTSAPVAPYVLRPEEFVPESPIHGAKHVMTHAVLRAPVAPGQERFPVLLYNHGGGWSRFTATYEFEELASRGYVVASVEHLGFDQSTSMPDGYTFKGDTLGFPEPTNVNLRQDAIASWNYLEAVLFPVWVADAQFALDRVALLDRDAASPLRGRLDLTRIGAFGWSFGGATAVDLAIRDPRIKAAVDQDGQLFGMGRVQGAKRPVMLMHNTGDPKRGVPAEHHAIVDDLMRQVEEWDTKFRASSTDVLYDVRIARTEHGNFSDLPLFFPRDTATLEPARAHAIITAYTLAFFDRHLRGIASPLLDAPSDAFPEVTFARRNATRPRGP